MKFTDEGGILLSGSVCLAKLVEEVLGLGWEWRRRVLLGLVGEVVEGLDDECDLLSEKGVLLDESLPGGSRLVM